MTLTTRTDPSSDWDAFVRARPSANLYQLSGWAQLARDVFRHPAHFVEARDESGALVGVLPLVTQKSLLFGSFMTSVPFFNYGGALSDAVETTRALMEHGRALAQSLGCRYLEFRDAQPQPGDWSVRTDKVSLVLDLPGDFAALSKQLGAKLRSQVKRADRENPSVRVGGAELLNEFYDIFSRTMRDLGTPVYPRRFFAAILERFPAECVVLVVDRAGQPAAAAFLLISNGRAEIPWAACRDDAKQAGFNMRLYWEVLRVVVEKGCRSFDFGRSTQDSGTYRFKLQWGAKPVQLYWHRWEKGAARSGTAPAQPQGRLMHYATSAWKRLPLAVANTLGPIVSPGLPW
ncbi:MAG TPA: FemAB family XrtA/PEP-CTERM system-associated protein [Steroidobacteraceae bacterium]